MKYKPGDKVKIKTWTQMMREFGLIERTRGYVYLKTMYLFSEVREVKLRKLDSRILTINYLKGNGYIMKEMDYRWGDDMIEYLLNDFKRKTSVFDHIDLD